MAVLERVSPQVAAGIGGALLTGVVAYRWLFSRCKQYPPNEGKSIAVVGGGIAGTITAWALQQSGYKVMLFEKTEEIGGNGKTFQWKYDDGDGMRDTVRSPLLVIAWPTDYYHNYHAVLQGLGIEREVVPIKYFIKTPRGNFLQDGQQELQRQHADDFARWTRLVRFTQRVNAVFNGTSTKTLYAFSYFNPLNLIPLYWLVKLYGISEEFWRLLFVPVHATSFLTTCQDNVPSVIAPLLEDIVPLERPGSMSTWVGVPKDVFDGLTAGFRENVYVNHDIVSVSRKSDGVTLRDAQGRSYDADSVVFACDSHAIHNCLENPSLLERLILSQVRYVDDYDPTFTEFVVHTDSNVLPKEHREQIREFNTFTEVREDGSLESTFLLSRLLPCTRTAPHDMFVTFNSRHKFDERRVLGRWPLPRPTHALSLRNLILMTLLRFTQGSNRTYYCGSFTTPEGAHDVSMLSGLVVAHAMGAKYPFEGVPSARADFETMQRIMLGPRARPL